MPSMKIAKAKIVSQLGLLLWSVVYVVSTNRILSSYYLAGQEEVVPYYKHFSFARFLFCLVIIEILRFFTTKAKTKVLLLSYVKEFLFILFVIPAIMGYALFDQKYYLEFLFFCVFYWLFFCFFCRFVSFAFVPLLNWNMPKKLERVTTILVTVTIVFLIIRSLGGIRFSLSLTDIYTTRAEFKENGSMTLTILKAALGCYICPFMIVKYLREKRLVLAGVFIVCQMLAYSMAKDKIYLLFLGVSVLFGILGGRLVKKPESTFSLSLYALSGMNILAIMGPFQNLIYNIFTRRIMVMPAWLQYINYEVFRDLPKIWWRQDTFLIDKLFTPVYSRSLVQIVADDYFRGWIGNPNNGMAGEAFTRCGYMGALIYPFLLVVFICLLYYFFRGLPKESVFMFSLALSMTVSNDVITSTPFVITMVVIICFTYLINKWRGPVECVSVVEEIFGLRD